MRVRARAHTHKHSVGVYRTLYCAANFPVDVKLLLSFTWKTKPLPTPESFEPKRNLSQDLFFGELTGVHDRVRMGEEDRT